MHISAAEFRIEAPLTLGDDEVHLWRLDLGNVDLGRVETSREDWAGAAGEEEKWQAILSEDEKARAARFRFEGDRHCFSATRAILRTILGSYVESEPKALKFEYSEKGKPCLSGNHSGTDFRNRIEFNVSHSGRVALLGFARSRAVGVDVEQIRTNVEVESIARRYFSEHEEQQLFALPDSERLSGFYRCWTRKEAFIKAVGGGLSLPLDQFDVSLKEGDENALLATRPDPEEVCRWTLRDVVAGSGYVGALCVQGQGWVLKC